MDETEVMQEVVQPTRRRRHSKEFKAQVIRAAMQPNVSIAAVALHYRLNANMLRSCVTAQEERDAAEAARKSMSDGMHCGRHRSIFRSSSSPTGKCRKWMAQSFAAASNASRRSPRHR